MKNGGGWTGGIKVYEQVNDSLIRIGANYENKPMQPSADQIFVVYTNHPINTDDSEVQTLFKPYLDRMKMRDDQTKDTLSIGTFQEFKKHHPELTENLLKGDSINS